MHPYMGSPSFLAKVAATGHAYTSEDGVHVIPMGALPLTGLQAANCIVWKNEGRGLNAGENPRRSHWVLLLRIMTAAITMTARMATTPMEITIAGEIPSESPPEALDSVTCLTPYTERCEVSNTT